MKGTRKEIDAIEYEALMKQTRTLQETVEATCKAFENISARIDRIFGDHVLVDGRWTDLERAKARDRVECERIKDARDGGND